MRQKKLTTAIALFSLLLLALVSGQSWDNYVFIESARMLIHGKDPYAYANSVKAYAIGLGPMWVTYPPLPLILWSLSLLPLVLLKVPLSAFYVLFVKLPSIMAVALSALIIRKMGYDWKWVVFNPIVVTSIFIHGMFDSIVAFLLLLTLYLIEENKLNLSALAYGLALSTKQHSVLALFPIALYLYRKSKSIKEVVAFVLISLTTFGMIVLTYSIRFGLKDLPALINSIFLFHSHRPPNSLGFGGFAVLNFYSDALSNFSGNTAVALSMGSTVNLYKIVDRASLLFIPAYIILNLVMTNPFEGILLSYIVYILLSYVGAIQHLVIPAIFASVILSKSELKKRTIRLLLLSFTLYSIQHILSFWDLFPMVLNPLFLKSYGLWLGKLSRIADHYVPSWDIVLRAIGVSSLIVALLSLISFVIIYMKDKGKPKIGYLIVAFYILEILILVALAQTLRPNSGSLQVSDGIIKSDKWCLVVPWENMEYPGYKFGDFLSKYAIPIYGYYSFIKPLAEKFVEKIKGRCNIAILARLDLFRSYEYVDLLSAIVSNRVEYAWVISINNYVAGTGSSARNCFERLMSVVRTNVPLSGYFELGGVLGLLNDAFNLFGKNITYAGYYSVNGKPVIFVIGNVSPKLKKEIERYGFHVYPFNGVILNVRGMGLSKS